MALKEDKALATVTEVLGKHFPTIDRAELANAALDARSALAAMLADNANRLLDACASKRHRGYRPAKGAVKAVACPACTPMVEGLQFSATLIDPDRPRMV